MQKIGKIVKPVMLVLIVAVVVLAGFMTRESGAHATAWALLAPVIAIALALITKEVYSSLFIGVVIGALLCGQFKFAPTMDAIINDGVITAVSDSAGIFAFLVILGIIVALINRSGASQAFGRWAQTHIKTRVGAALATFALGVLIFIDDYFNCLTRRYGHAARDRHAQDLACQAGVPDRRNGRSYLYDRSRFLVGGGSFGKHYRLVYERNRAVRTRHPLQLLFASDAGVCHCHLDHGL